MKRLSIFRDGLLLFNEIYHANSFWQRSRGLLYRANSPTRILGGANLTPEQGLMLSPCSSVHTLGMPYPVDVIFLDREFRILKIAVKLMPWRASAERHARHVLELAAGSADQRNLKVDDLLVCEPYKNNESQIVNKSVKL